MSCRYEIACHKIVRAMYDEKKKKQKFTPINTKMMMGYFRVLISVRFVRIRWCVFGWAVLGWRSIYIRSGLNILHMMIQDDDVGRIESETQNFR